MQAVAGQYARLHVFDPECEVSIRAKQPVVTTSDELAKPTQFQCFDCSQLYTGDLKGALDFYADYVFECARRYEGKSMFCVDEMQKITDTDNVSHELACIIETGRRWQIDTTFITQQINLVHNRVRNQQTEVVTFRQNDSRAIDWLSSFGFDEHAIRELNTGEFICRTDQGVEKTGNIFKLSGRSTASVARPVSDDHQQRDSNVPENNVDTTQESSIGE